MEKINREVDIKALVSHIVKGDGEDRCRICMTDTSEGQVFLEDTVMLDGERPVTLAELLENITGIAVETTTCLPNGVCGNCATLAFTTNEFLKLFKASNEKWTEIIHFFYSLNSLQGKRSYYVVIDKSSGPNLVTDRKGAGKTVKEALRRIKERLGQKAESTKRTTKQRELRSLTNSEFVCQDCGAEFLNINKLNGHIKDSFKKACTHCNVVLNIEQFAKHLESHDGVCYACNFCPEVFDDGPSLKTHCTKSHVGPYVCEECKHNFLSAQTLARHISVHAIQTCTGCFKQFKNGSCFSNHVDVCLRKNAERGNTKKNWVCPDCGCKFNDLLTLNQHIRENGIKVCFRCYDVISIVDFKEHLRGHRLASFDCRKCGESYEHTNSFQRHLNMHSNGKLICDHCKKTFLSKNKLISHLKTHTFMFFNCATCNRRFSNRKCYTKHTQKCIHNQAVGACDAFKCPNCDMKFISFYYFARHLTESKSRVCHVCWMVVRIDDLKDHMKSHAIVTYDCKVCPDTFETQRKLKSHLQVHERRPYVCIDCQHTFRSNQALAVHTKVHQINVCPGCWKRFDNKKCFAHHNKRCLKRNSSAENYVCDYCQRKYRHKQALTMHIKLHHLFGRQHQCEKCGKRFTSNAALIEHKNTHKRDYKYVCKLCSVRVSSRRGYQRHVRAHTGEKPYPCTFCESKFVTASERTRHVVYKHGNCTVASYECGFCPSKYSQKENLAKHIALKHSSGPVSVDFDRCCDFCGTRFRLEAEYDEHVKSHAETVNEVIIYEQIEEIDDESVQRPRSF